METTTETTKRIGRPPIPPTPAEIATELSLSNVGYARLEGDLSMRALSHLGMLRRQLERIAMRPAERKSVDTLVEALRRDICEQLDIDCRDLKDGMELSELVLAGFGGKEGAALADGSQQSTKSIVAVGV